LIATKQVSSNDVKENKNAEGNTSDHSRSQRVQNEVAACGASVRPTAAEHQEKPGTRHDKQ